jgi:MGT family glycosyltransferase
MIGHPAAGHINPTLAVMRELIARGERVIYYASEPFRSRIEATGAEFRALGDHALFERNLGSGGILGGMAGLAETAETVLPQLIADFVRDGPAYLMVEAHALWGNLLAQIAGLPTATLCSMFAINDSLIPVSGIIDHLYGSAAPEAALDGLSSFGRYYETARRLTNRYRASLPGVIGYLGNPQRLNVVLTSRDFQIGGDGFDPSYRFVGPSVAGRSDERDFPMDRLDRGPLILISMGTMYNDESALYHNCFDAFGGSDYQVVLAAGHRMNPAKLRQAPANFIVRQYVPQVTLLERASAFITHGGINSAHEAMLAGVPMIVLPLSADHHVVAGRVEAVGAGIVLPRAQATPEHLVRLMTRLTGEPEFATRSRAMGETLRAAGGPKRAADEIFQFRSTAVN